MLIKVGGAFWEGLKAGDGAEAGTVGAVLGSGALPLSAPGTGADVFFSMCGVVGSGVFSRGLSRDFFFVFDGEAASRSRLEEDLVSSVSISSSLESSWLTESDLSESLSSIEMASFSLADGLELSSSAMGSEGLVSLKESSDSRTEVKESLSSSEAVLCGPEGGIGSGSPRESVLVVSISSAAGTLSSSSEWACLRSEILFLCLGMVRITLRTEESSEESFILWRALGSWRRAVWLRLVLEVLSRLRLRSWFLEDILGEKWW